MLSAIRVAARIIKVRVGNVVGRWFHGFCVASNNTAPLIAVTRVGEQSDRDSFHGSKSCRRKVFAQGAALAVGLIEAPERCGGIQRLQPITHLKEPLLKINLAEPASLAADGRSSHAMLNPGQSR